MSAGAQQRILVVEDDPALCAGLADNLRLEGYLVECVADGEAAMRHALTGGYALIVLDVMLPGRDGYSICRELRRSGAATPVIMLTARSQQPDKVRGLDLGADDYVTKPFDLMELLSRIRAVLRRGTLPAHLPRFTIGDVTVEVDRCQAMRGNIPLDLTPRDIDILSYLHARRGQVISREELLERIWGYETMPTTRTVDTHIARIRSQVEPDPGNPLFIIGVRGKGYRLDLP